MWARVEPQTGKKVILFFLYWSACALTTAFFVAFIEFNSSEQISL
jgi:hypothetical protein